MEFEIPRKLKGKELSEFLVEKLDELADNICQDPDELERFVKQWNNGFHSYSLNNIILAWIQRPNFRLLAGYKKWMMKGRKVKSGERCVRILAPMKKKIKTDDETDDVYIISGFRPVAVFDIEQTESQTEEGDEINVGCSELISGDVDLEKLIKASPVPVHMKDLGLSNGNTNGKEINITPKKNSASVFSTLTHEIAHIKLGHCDNKGILFETDDRSAKEIEAETVSYIVTSCLGLENSKSRLYVGNWGANKEELQSRGKKIISVAESILRDIASVS